MSPLHANILAWSMHSLFEYSFTGQSFDSSTCLHVSLIYVLPVWIFIHWPVPWLLYMLMCQPNLCTPCLNISWLASSIAPLHPELVSWYPPDWFIRLTIINSGILYPIYLYPIRFPVLIRLFRASLRRLDTSTSLVFDSGNTYTIVPASEYHSADSIWSLTMYNPPDIRWDVLSGTMS